MTKKIVKIATFNALNLALPNRKYYNKHYTQQVYDKKIAWIGNQLDIMGADIVGFQEVFDEEALRQAVEKSSSFNSKFHVAVSDTKGGSPAVACVSKYPIIKTRVISEFPSESIIDFEFDDDSPNFIIPFKRFSRPVLNCVIEVTPEIHLSFYVVHLKSKRPIFQDTEDRENPVEFAKAQARSLMLRTAESTALRTILAKEMQHTETAVIVVGDVNDTGSAVTTRMISGEAPHRRADRDKKMKTWDILLYHAKDIQARRSFNDVYYTHIHNGHYESLDHIMVSQELVAENPKNIGKIGYVKVFNDHLIDQTFTNEKTKSWQSDHGHVVASLEFRLNNEK